MSEKELRRYSRVVVDGVEQAPSRAMLRAVGFSEDDFQRPQIGIASTWSMVTPCNMHIDGLADEAAKGADEAGAKGVIFNTISVSSLVSREIIADSIEAVTGAEGFDGLVAIGGCDKNMPGCVMAMARLNRPAVFVYGGTIKPGAKRRDIVSVFEARPSVRDRVVRSTTRSFWRSSRRRFRVPVPAVECTQRTRWRRLSKHSA
jgi:dihydroxy-acid dehydratase